MLTIKKTIAEKLKEGIEALGAPTAPEAAELAGMLEYPPDTTMGDLALPCFKPRSPTWWAIPLTGGQ